MIKSDKQFNDWRTKSKLNKMLVPINIYRPYVEFYNPGKAESHSNSIWQNRPTILWKSDVYFNGNKPVKFKIPNQIHQGKVIITVNGVSENNLVGTGRARYEVQNSMVKNN